MCYMGQEFSTISNLLASILLVPTFHSKHAHEKYAQKINVEESFYYNEREQNTMFSFI